MVMGLKDMCIICAENYSIGSEEMKKICSTHHTSSMSRQKWLCTGPHLLLIFLFAPIVYAEAIFHLDASLTRVLPNPFARNWTTTLLGPSSFFSTSTGNVNKESDIQSGYNSTFISLSKEFDSLFGNDPQAVLAVNASQPYFHEAGVWVPGNTSDGSNGTVWFTKAAQEKDSDSSNVHILDLSNNHLSRPALSSNLSAPNGGTLYGSPDDHAVLLTTQGSMQNSGSIVKIDTRTYSVETLVNSYWGLRLNSPNDVAFATFEQGNVIFFSDPTFGAQGHLTGSPQLNNAVWRLDLDSGFLVNVISALDVPIPNGIQLDNKCKKLYVCDWSGAETNLKGNSTASLNIYVFDLDQYGTPMNKRVFATSTSSLLPPDGIKIDDEGRVWTGEGGGIFVRSKRGNILGFINPIHLFQPPNANVSKPAIANFALAGDEIVIGAEDRVYRVKLSRQIVNPDRIGRA